MTSPVTGNRYYGGYSFAGSAGREQGCGGCTAGVDCIASCSHPVTESIGMWDLVSRPGALAQEVFTEWAVFVGMVLFG